MGIISGIRNFFAGIIQGVTGVKVTGVHIPNPVDVTGHVLTGNIRGVVQDFFAPTVNALNGPKMGDKTGVKPVTAPAVAGAMTSSMSAPQTASGKGGKQSDLKSVLDDYKKKAQAKG